MSGTLAYVDRESESVDRAALRGEIPSIPTDLFSTQVNANLLAPCSNQSNSNSPTRKGGPESSCTRNGCADSIPIVSRDHVECSTPVDQHVEYSSPLLNVANNSNANTNSSVTNSSNANTDSNDTNDSKANTVSNDTTNFNANTDLNNIINSNANTDLPNTNDTYATWCHTGGLLRSDTSVGSSMLSPLTHGASATNGSVVTPRNDPAPDNREPILNHTFHNATIITPTSGNRS